MDIDKYLLKLGFNEKEIKVYGVILVNAPVSLTELSDLSSFKRTSLYFLVDRLKKAGLLGNTIKGKRKLIIPASPENLKRIETEKEEELETTKKLVQNLINKVNFYFRNKNFAKPKVRFYQGSEEIKNIMEEVINCKSKEYWYVGSINLLEGLYPDSYWQKFIRKRNEKGVKSYSIINNEDAAGYKYNDSLREVKVFPEGNNFDAVVVVYDNKFGVISSKKENYAFVIENHELVKVFKMFIRIAWRISTPLYIKR